MLTKTKRLNGRKERELKIDKDFTGLIKCSDYYVLYGDFETDESLTVDLDKELFISGSLKVGGLLEVTGSLRVRGWLKVAGSLLKVGGSLEVSGSLDVREWMKVAWSLTVGGTITLCGVETTTLHMINGVLPYTIWLLDTHTKIGCTMLSNEEWLDLTEEEAEELGDEDGEMWENREFIYSLINSSKGAVK